MCIVRFFKNRNDKKLYHSTMELIEQRNITNLRKKIRIVIIDDADDDIFRALESRQYEVFYKADMTYAIEAEPFDIVIMDVRGVAKRIQSSMEGFSLACEIKKKYPLKKVCCYSGSPYKEISEQLADKKIDAFFVKDIDLDKMCDKIDHLIYEYVNYESQWEVLRAEMHQNSIDEETIHKIHDVYSQSFEKCSFTELNVCIMENVKNTTTMLNITSAILNLIKILAV